MEQTELQQTDKKTIINPQYRGFKHPGPGRPKGCKNKYTKIKEDIVSLWKEEDCKERFRKVLRKDLKWAVNTMIAIMPKEPVINNSISTVTQNTNYYNVVQFGNPREDATSSRVSNLDKPVAN